MIMLSNSNLKNLEQLKQITDGKRVAEELPGDPIVRPHPRSGPDVKNGRSSAKMVRRRGSDAGQSRRK